MSEYLTPTENLTGNLTPVDTLNGLIQAEDVLTGQLGVAGGGAGTSNYNDLTNKPSINNVTLQGNKTTADLNLPDQISELSDVVLTDLQSGDMLTYVPEEGWINRRSANTLRSLDDVNANNPVGGHALIYNSTQEKWIDAPYSYGNLTGKPKLNNVTISGDKTSADYGLFSGDYDDLTNKPVYNQVINLGYNTSDKVISSNTLADILNSPTVATTEAGTYTYMIILTAGWEIPQGNFYTAINVDGSNNNSTTTYAAPQGNSICIFFGEITLTAGQHTINVRGRVSGTAGKAVTIPSYASVIVWLIRK